MNATNWKAALVQLTLYVAAASAVALIPTNPNAEKRCDLERAYNMIGYYCANRDLRDVPQYLKSDVEILDLSYNRIRELRPRSFALFEDIKFLYLFDNMILSIEANTFSRMQSLEAIDLSTNGLTTIPKELFDLPMLRNLHVSHNNLVHLTYDLSLITKPIRAPLQVISLSKCNLSTIPNFGPLPDLLLLNVSQNELANLAPDAFAPLCSLTTVDLNGTETPRCMCFELRRYLAQRHIRTDGTDPHCDRRHASAEGDALDALSYCAESASNAATELASNNAYNECMTLVKTRESIKQSRSTWMWILIALAAFFVAFMGVLYGLHLRNVRALRLTKMAERNRKPLAAATAGTTISPVGGGGGRLALDVVAGNDEALLHATTKV